jgi:hypothetical protein
MHNDKVMWAVLGPLSRESYIEQQDMSDRHCTDVTVTTAAGTTMTLAEFYEMKRIFMHKALYTIESVNITPRNIDDAYVSLTRMLNPPSGHSAQTIQDFISNPKLKSTGNWGRILRNTFIEMGGSPGQHRPDLVLKIVHQIHDALRARYEADDRLHD